MGPVRYGTAPACYRKHAGTREGKAVLGSIGAAGSVRLRISDAQSYMTCNCAGMNADNVTGLLAHIHVAC